MRHPDPAIGMINCRVSMNSGLSLSWSLLVGPDQHSRKPTSTEWEKNEIRPAKKKIKKIKLLRQKAYDDWHISSKIG